MDTVELEILCTWDCPLCFHKNILNDWGEGWKEATQHCKYCGLIVKVVKETINEKD